MSGKYSPPSYINLFEVLNSVKGKFSIIELEEIFICLVFLRFIKDSPRLYMLDTSIDIFKNNYLEGDYRLNDGFIDLNSLFRKVEKDNPEFEGIFSSFEFNSQLKSQDFKAVVIKIIKSLSVFNFQSQDFGRLFDDILKGVINSRGKGFDSLQPKELSDLMLHFIPYKQHLSVYNPFSGFSSLGLDLPLDSLYFGEERSNKIWAYSKLRLLAHKVKNKNSIHNVDVFESWSTNDISFDFIVTNPPFNLKVNDFDDRFDVDDRFYIKNNANSFIVSQCYKRLTPEGKAVIALPNSFLNSQNTKEKALREYLTKQGALEMVISLPGGILNYTSIPFNLLVLTNSSEKKEPTLVDASECFKEVSRNNKILDLDRIYSILNSENEFKRQVEINEIIENDFNLIPARYFIEDFKLEIESGYKLVELRELIYSRPKSKVETDVRGKYLRIRDLSDDKLSYVKNFENLDEINLSNSIAKTTSLLSENSLLFSLRWKTFKPTFFTSSNSKVFYPTNDILACNVNENLIDLDYLILELDKEYVLRQIENERKGATIPYISKEKLLSIVIKVPSLLEQQKSDVKLVKEALIKAKLKELGLEEQFAQLKKEQIEDLSLKKHNIMQHLNNMQSSLDSLLLFMKQNNGLLEADKIIYPKFGTTVAKRFQLLAESLSEAIYFVDNITNEISFNPSEFVDANELLTICEEKGIKKDFFDFDSFYDKDTFIIDGEEQKPIIKFSKLDFLELYNNILENAILHGFTDSSKKYLFKTELKFDQELNKVVISFLNNGKPFPRGMAERYKIKGEKAGTTGNKGIGSWKVFEIAKHFGAEIIVQDLVGEEFPVRIDLLINLENE